LRQITIYHFGLPIGLGMASCGEKKLGAKLSQQSPPKMA